MIIVMMIMTKTIKTNLSYIPLMMIIVVDSYSTRMFSLFRFVQSILIQLPTVIITTMTDDNA